MRVSSASVVLPSSLVIHSNCSNRCASEPAMVYSSIWTWVSEHLCALGCCAWHLCGSLQLKEQLPMVDPLACTLMKAVAKCDIVLRIAEFSHGIVECTWHRLAMLLFPTLRESSGGSRGLFQSVPSFAR